jgi:hypothetical protein
MKLSVQSGPTEICLELWSGLYRFNQLDIYCTECYLGDDVLDVLLKEMLKEISDVSCWLCHRYISTINDV